MYQIRLSVTLILSIARGSVESPIQGAEGFSCAVWVERIGSVELEDILQLVRGEEGQFDTLWSQKRLTNNYESVAAQGKII